MLAIQFIRQNPERVKDAVRKKGLSTDIDRLLAVDADLSRLRADLQNLNEERNRLSPQIPKLQGDERAQAVERGKQIKVQQAELEERIRALEPELEALMLLVPGIPVPEVPEGKTDADNKEIRRWGTPRTFDFEPWDHLQLGKHLDIIDVERGAKVGGSRSYFLKGAGALMEYAVCQLAIKILSEQGFRPVVGPLLVRDAAMTGTGFFPLGREETYHLEKDELNLVGTSEVPLASMHMDEILDEAELPKLYAGYSTCFRREAGSYGRDTKGVYRVHQFQKVEQVIVCRADEAESEKWHYILLGNAEKVVQSLGLPYRVALACTGEIGLGQVRKHEIESWMPSRKAYSETHSCSTLHDFQARRLMIRYRAKDDGKVYYCHTLNNTAVASPRILIPILETYQNADRTVTVPEALRPFMGGLEKIEPQR